MHSVEITVMLKLRAIRNCRKILDDHLKSPEVLAYLNENEQEELIEGMLPEVKYDLKCY